MGGVWIDNICKSQFMNYINYTPSNKTSPPSILDSGTTGNLLAFDAPCVNKQIAVAPMEVKLPDGDFIHSTHTATVNIPSLIIAAREAHIFPIFFQHSLLSIGKLCDNGCEVNFLAHNVAVKLHGDTVLMGQREHDTGIWRVNLIITAEANANANATYNEKCV
jgi:hypothetical protein